MLGQSLQEYAVYGVNGYAVGLRVAGLWDFPLAGDWARTHGFLFRENEEIWAELIKERFSTGNLSDIGGEDG